VQPILIGPSADRPGAARTNAAAEIPAANEPNCRRVTFFWHPILPQAAFDQPRWRERFT
jgi:hypothetical protein